MASLTLLNYPFRQQTSKDRQQGKENEKGYMLEVLLSS